MNTFEAILSRRTHKDFNGEPVTQQQLEQLLELATFAPNHKLTEPWRFFVVPHEHVAELAQVVVNAIRDDDHPKLRNKIKMFAEELPKLGAFITVARIPVPDDPTANAEELAACACAVQNILLGATAMGFGSYWSTAKIFERPTVREFLGIPDGMERIASIWLGGVVGEAVATRRPFSELTHWV